MIVKISRWVSTQTVKRSVPNGNGGDLQRRRRPSDS